MTPPLMNAKRQPGYAGKQQFGARGGGSFGGGSSFRGGRGGSFGGSRGGDRGGGRGGDRGGAGGFQSQRGGFNGRGGTASAPSGAPAAAPAAPATATIVVHGFPTALEEIYGRTLQQRCPEVVVPFPEVIEEPDGASLLYKMLNKGAARVVRDRIHRSICYGTRWRLSMQPWSSVRAKALPCAVDVTSSAPRSLDFVETALRPLPGLLDVAIAEDGADPSVPSQAFVATFADEGSALHARAVLSGRKQDGGVHLFIKRRPPVDAAAAVAVSDD